MADAAKKLSKNQERKHEIASDWAEKVQKSQGLVFTDYKGMTHHQLEALKKASKKLDAEFVVTKNRLMLIALKDKDLSDEDKNQFQNPTATLFMYSDIVEPIKTLAKTMKEISLPTVKFGIIENKSVSASDVAKLATLPGLPQLRAQFVGGLMSPLYGLHRALNWNLQMLVLTLNAVKDKKGATS